MSRSETDYLYREIVLDRIYHTNQIAERPRLVVDVGANIGLFALYAAASWQPECIICLEAIPDVRDLLRRNLARNVTGPTEILVPDVAAGACDGAEDFIFYPGYSMMSGRYADPDADFGMVHTYAVGQLDDQADQELLADIDELLRPRFAFEHRQVRVAPLSEICAAAGRSTIDVLKIDVEGDETAVLAGLGGVVVRNAFVEVDARRSSVAAVRAALEAYGLTVAQLTQGGYESLPLMILTGSSE
ncbi:MAG: FkbM family methyltransferase [Jatrophihabitantaceae bacterium]